MSMNLYQLHFVTLIWVLSDWRRWSLARFFLLKTSKCDTWGIHKQARAFLGRTTVLHSCHQCHGTNFSWSCSISVEKTEGTNCLVLILLLRWIAGQFLRSNPLPCICLASSRLDIAYVHYMQTFDEGMFQHRTRMTRRYYLNRLTIVGSVQYLDYVVNKVDSQ